jgi:hypothetical protein
MERMRKETVVTDNFLEGVRKITKDLCQKNRDLTTERRRSVNTKRRNLERLKLERRQNMVSGRERHPEKVRPTASGATGLIRNKIHVYRPCHKEFAGATGLAIWLHIHNYILYLSINYVLSRLQFHKHPSREV